MKAFLGLDTSCYTTSAALCCLPGGAVDGLFFQERRLLAVAEGQRGLAQSEGVFQHVTRLPELMEKLFAAHPEMEIGAVCASAKPRPVQDSYMPVFRVGSGHGRVVAAALGVPFFETTHQQGHIRAALMGTALEGKGLRPFLALHLSGGTTEVLRVEEEACACLGGTLDLHAGQLVDRIGVALGLPFPAGPHLETLAVHGREQARLTASVKGLDCHFSGAEAQAMRLLEAGEPPENIAAEAFACVSRTVARLVVAAGEKTGISDMLLFGGVASSMLLREQVKERVGKRRREMRLCFGRPELSGDNAVGVAMIGAEKYRAVEGERNGGTDY